MRTIDDSAPIEALLGIMRRLRDPANGCPWDLDQDFASIVPHTIEEAHEVADVVERGAWDELRGELGDLLFQVVFLARLAEERGWFDFDDVARAIADKMRHRHPHVFGDAELDGDADPAAQWEARKAEEQRRAGIARESRMDGVPLTLPALTRAAKMQSRAARLGLDWPDSEGPLAKCLEELDAFSGAAHERAREVELGDLLFSCVNLARHLGIDAEQALRGATRRFEQRARHVEWVQNQRGRALSEEELSALWEEAKREEKLD